MLKSKLQGGTRLMALESIEVALRSLEFTVTIDDVLSYNCTIT